MADTFERVHSYHAEATALSGELRRPLDQIIAPQAFVKLPEQGGYLAQRSCEFRVESVLSFRSAYTQVAGNRELKPGHAVTTLATAVVEGLNVLDIVTADLVVAQIFTEHPLDGYVPRISFLGTRFENLRIEGHPVKLDLDLNLFGNKPEYDAPYTQSEDFVSRVSDQHARIREGQSGHPNLLTELLERYNRLPESFESFSGDEETVECSLVNEVEGSFPGHSCGHVIHVPDFGTVYLATVGLRHSDYVPGTRIPRKTLLDLTMIDIRMGCASTGTLLVTQSITNGSGKPNQPPPPPQQPTP